MIRKFEDINVKSYNNYSNELSSAGKVNVFFGTNGSGKSALSQWIIEQDVEHSKIFNTHYVRDNIDAVDDISGIRLTVGKEAIDNQGSIKIIEEANDRIRYTISTLNTKKNEYKRELYEFMNTQLGNARKQFSFTKNKMHSVTP